MEGEENSRFKRRSWSDGASLRPMSKGFKLFSVPETNNHENNHENGENNAKNGVSDGTVINPSSQPSKPPPTTASSTSMTTTSILAQCEGSTAVADSSKEAVTLVVPSIVLPTFGTSQNSFSVKM